MYQHTDFYTCNREAKVDELTAWRWITELFMLEAGSRPTVDTFLEHRHNREELDVHGSFAGSENFLLFTASPSVLSVPLATPIRGGVPRTQKSRFPLLRTQSYRGFSLWPNTLHTVVGGLYALSGCPAAGNSAFLISVFPAHNTQWRVLWTVTQASACNLIKLCFALVWTSRSTVSPWFEFGDWRGDF